MKQYKKLEHYGIIGNLNTIALVGIDGSIDWFCQPYIESPSVFAGILDTEKGGHFRIQPVQPYESVQKYLPKTNVLQTIFSNPAGIVNVTDFMPVQKLDSKETTIYRKISCEEGHVDLELSFKPRFDYARGETIVKSNSNDSNKSNKFSATLNGQNLYLKSSINIKKNIENNELKSIFKLKTGESVWFMLSNQNTGSVNIDFCDGNLNKTKEYWQNWAHNCSLINNMFTGFWHDLIIRSELVLKLLINRTNGAIYAAPTTSLPEAIGGVRNWDYRFFWLRDTSFTLQALYNLGHENEATGFIDWIVKLCHEYQTPTHLKILYSFHNDQNSIEQVLEHLSGYKNSSPVRIGNGASGQKQLDIYGEVINTIYLIVRYKDSIDEKGWNFVRNTADYICDVWSIPDSSIWEIRGEPRHYVYSKLMCWVALDRAIKIVELADLDYPTAKWQKDRETIKNAILEKGFNKELNSFVQYFDSDKLDATSLLIPVMEFLPFDDPRVQGTIDATKEKLMTQNCLVYRYLGDDNLPGGEGAFILCSFWLIDNLILSGRVEEGEEFLMNLLNYISPLGLYSEEIDTKTLELLGNFPQSFSHIGLINSVLYLGLAKGKKPIGPIPLGIKTDKQ